MTLTFALALALQGLADGALPDEVGDETKTFAVQPGDALAINNDFGKIRIRPWEGASLDIKIQKTAPDQARKSSLKVEFRKSGSTVFVNSFFSGASGEAIDFEIKAPKFMNMTISGANPEIDIAGVQGLARAQTVTGRIIAENLTAAASLTTDSGDIIYRTNVQPQGDVRLESTSGNVYCELENGFNLRSWIRAGGNISWDMDPTLQATSLEKQLGTSGPLLYAGSLKGNVIVRLKPSVAVPAAVASSQTTPTSGVAPKNPEPLQAVPKAAEARTTAPASPAQEVQPVPSPATSKASVPRTTAPAPSAQEVKREPSLVEGQQPVILPGTLKVDVDSVFLNVSVRDRNSNRSIGGLQKEDFRIYEDGVRQQVAQFQPSEAPFNLLLLLDVSGSTQSYLHLMKQAAIDFTHQIKTNDRVAIATFSSNVQLVENFTNDRAVAERAINRIKSGGGTAFYDALMTCLNRYMRGVEGRSAIVVFTDGVDNQLEGRGGSRTTYNELYRRVQETDTVIYTIFLDTEGQASAITRGPTRRPGGIGGWPGGRRGGGFPGGYPFPLPVPQPSPSPNPRRQQNQRAIYEEARDQLLEIAEQTGGRMYSPHKIGELSGVYSEIADDLRIQYQLGYNSTNRARDGAWREIRVQVENRPEAVVRTRKGYYARKDVA